MNSYLNTENLARSTDEVEYHPLRPFLPRNAKVLFLGSFPPQRKRWCMDFYYPNFINDHWRIEGEIFFGDRNHFVDAEKKTFRLDEIVDFCRQRGLAFFDTSTAVRRLQNNASDKFLEVVEPTDVPALLRQLPELRAIVTTGEKATETICASMHVPVVPKVNAFVAVPPLLLYRLPSSSRAYPLSFDKKVEAYRRMFASVGLLAEQPQSSTTEQTTMNIRQANIADLPRILELRDLARGIMRSNGNRDQWPEGYPTEETFRSDIAEGHSYVIEQDGTLVATFAFIPGPDPTYSVVYGGGRWLDDARPYCVVHRIASTPDAHGVMDALLGYCFSQTDNLRIDTHRDNSIMRHLLTKHGFAYCGIIHIANGDERLAYQKILGQHG